MSQSNKAIEIIFIKQVLTWLIAIILALVPVFAVKYWFIGVILQKAWLFYGLTTLLVLGYLLLIYLDKTFLPKINFIGKWWLALIVILIVTTFTSIQPDVSFWGHFSRMEGLVAWIYYTLFGLVALGVLREKADWIIVLKGLVVGCVAICLYAVAQLLGWGGAVLSLDPTRLEGSLGNPVFLGGYLAVVLPIILVGIFIFKSNFWKILTIGTIILNIAILILTFTRSSWVAVSIAVIIGLLLVAYKLGIKKTKKWLFGLFIVVFSALILTQWLLPGSINNQRDRLFNIQSIDLRLNNWRVTTQAVLDRPLLGWGLENINIAFSRYYTPFQDEFISFQESHVDRAHNGYLDFATTGGIPALFAFLGVLIGSFIIFYRRYLKKMETVFFVFNIGFFLVLISYSIYIFTSFHLITNILPVLLAIVWFANSDPFKISNKNTKIGDSWWPGLVVGGVSIILLTTYVFIIPAKAVAYANRATESVYVGSYFHAIDLFDKAISQNSWMSNPIRLHSAVLGSIKGIGKTPEWSKFQVSAAKNMQDYIKEQPHHSYGWLMSGMYFGNLNHIDDIYVRKAEKSFEMTTSLSPNTAEPWFRWAEMYESLGLNEKAQEKYNQALLKEPGNWVVLFNSGSFEIANGQESKGIAKLSHAYDLGYCPRFGDVLDKLSEEAHEALILSYNRIIECNACDQDKAFSIVNLALLYKEQGDLDKTLDTAKLIDNYNIKFQELNKFKEDLGLDW